ncbi:MAG: hypothetical protein HPM95_00565 [Alphaproteobacteria bacterium]|nr:hypothetical protein [Alphaproteobacteria bacterium]
MIEENVSYYSRSVGYPATRWRTCWPRATTANRWIPGSSTISSFRRGQRCPRRQRACRPLRDRQAVGSSPDPHDCIDPDALASAVATLASGYDFIARDVRAADTGVTMLVHGYDYPAPRAGEPWLAVPFTAKGYDLTVDEELIAGILRHLVDAFYDMLEGVAGKHAHVQVVNLRNVVDGRWNDELHPQEAASVDLAAKFTDRMPAAPVA